MKLDLEFMENHVEESKAGFSKYEVSKFKRIYYWVKEASKIEYKNQLIDFYIFINEFDNRKKKNFIKIFPELESIYIRGKKHYYKAQLLNEF